MEVAREELHHREQRVDAEPGEARHQEHRGRLALLDVQLLERPAGGERLEDRVQALQPRKNAAVVPLDDQAHDDQGAGDHHRQPGAFEELLEDVDDENEAAEDEADDRHRHRRAPLRIFLLRVASEPVAEHAGLAERERHEDVDGVHHHQGVDGAPRVDEHEQAGAAHQQHAVLHGQAVGERAQPVGQVRVVRQVRHHPRPRDEAGLRRHEQQQGLGRERRHHEPVAEG